MYQSGKTIGLWSAISLGAGAMVGAGIFALLGQASAIAGSAVYLSFIAGGLIALLSGYSLSKLGVRYPAAGGIVEYLVQSYGEGYFSGVMSVMLYIAALVALSLIARTFGSYASLFVPEYYKAIAVPVLAGAIVVMFTVINLEGTRNVARLENIIVLVKFIILLVFSIVSLGYIDPERLSTDTYPGLNPVLFSLAVTFFAYEGFRVITNTVEDMENPERTLPRAMFISILLVMLLYVTVALAVFGNLPVNEVIKAKDYALAEAARPVFGTTGFTVVAIAALLSTASAINANLYAVTNISYQMARNGTLPSNFSKPIGHSKQGLIISSVIILLLAVVFDLSEIAAIGSISILFVHAVVHFGHLRVLDKTGASSVLVFLALLATLSALVLAGYYVMQHSLQVSYLLGLFVLISVTTEILLRKKTGRIVRKRHICSDDSNGIENREN